MNWLILTVLFSVAEPWDFNNDVTQLVGLESVENQIRELPTNGRSASRIWGGFHYPLKKGGTASALKKLERVSSLSFGAYRWEIDFNKENAKYNWGGHCNGLAVAGMLEPEPQRPVVFNGVKFSVSEVKALAVELYQGPMPIIGDRCYTHKNEVEYDSTGRAVDPHCRDLNPGTFHIAMTNLIGIQKKAMIVDIYPGSVVWNYPAFEFKSKIRPVDEAKASRLLNLDQDTYPYNPQATQFFHVRTVLTTMHKKTNEKLEYLLEVNDAGQIVGGEWIGKTRKRHPDFIWVPDGGYSLENPFLDTWTMSEIVRKSQ